jgi:hypothetical protein
VRRCTYFLRRVKVMEANVVSVASVYFVTKVISMVLSWFSAYLSERDIHARYVDRVYLNDKAAPPLSGAVTTLIGSYFGMVAALTAVVCMGLYIFASPISEILVYATWMTFDTVVSCTLSSVVLTAVARQISDHRYFNYQLEGLRAIRALRIIMEKTMFVLTLFPYALCVGVKNAGVFIASLGRAKRFAVAAVLNRSRPADL